MRQKTFGIVLQSIKYSDTSLIVKIYTRDFGLQSYILRSAFSKKSRIKKNLFLPLTPLNLVVSTPVHDKLGTLYEAGIEHAFSEIPVNISKATIIQFLNEVLLKCLKENPGEPEQFDFILNSLIFLDKTHGSIGNFHIYFLLELSKFLGFYPSDTQGKYFDLNEGRFADQLPFYHEHLDQETALWMGEFLNADIEHSLELKIPPGAKKSMLIGLVNYYRLHVPGFREIKSLEVLQSVMH